MCLWRTSQVVGKEHSAEARVEWAREGGESNQYWSAIGPVLVTMRSSTGHYCLPVLVCSATSTGSFYTLYSSAHRDRRGANAYLYWSAGEPI